MRKYFKSISVELNDQLQAIKNEHPKNYTCLSVALIESHLEKLKIFINKNPFKSADDEIFYFKYQKPDFISKLIYLKKVRQIENGKPHGSMEDKKNHLDDELKRLNRYYKANFNFIQYLNSEKTNLDAMYFIRQNAKDSPMIESYSSEIDYQYGTGFDLRIGTIKAHELIEVYLHEQLEILKNPKVLFSKFENLPYQIQYETQYERSNLQWTGTQVALVELVYALYVSKNFNNGDANIKQIAKCFEKAFDIKLSNVYRTLADIKKRNSGDFEFIKSLNILLKSEFEDNF